MNNLFLIPSMAGIYGSYSRFDSDDNPYLSYYDDCLFNKGERIGDASFRMQMLIIDYLSRVNTDNAMTDEEVITRKENIMKDLTLDEKQIIETFGHACVEIIGSYSEDKEKHKTLKKERND